MRGIPGMTIIDPCDAIDTEQAVPAMAAHDGPVYMRLLRGKVPVVLDQYNYQFKIGKAALLEEGNDVLIVASGLMTMRALEAAKQLRKDNVSVAVLHSPTIKPLDEETILGAGCEAGTAGHRGGKPQQRRRVVRSRRVAVDAQPRERGFRYRRAAGRVP